jgi:hypothetical protein
MLKLNSGSFAKSNVTISIGLFCPECFARNGDANRLDYEDYLQALRTKKADRNSYIRFGKRTLQHPHTKKDQNSEEEDVLNSLNFLQAANRNRRGSQESSYIRFGKRNTNVSNVKSYSCV